MNSKKPSLIKEKKKKTLTISKSLKKGTKELEKKKIKSAILDTEILLSFVLKKNKEYLYTYPEKKITEKQLKRFQSFLNQRKKLLPIAYLTKNKEFYGLNFYVNKNVLIPRSETELLVEEVLKLVKQKNNQPTILEIGTGSGSIAVSLAKHLKKTKIIATDISKKALFIAKKNAKKHKVLKKIQFIQGDLLKPITKKQNNIQIIVANLPYLTKKESKKLPYEPQKALNGSKNGLTIIKRLLNQLKNFKQINIFLEINPHQKKEIQKIIKEKLKTNKISFLKDLNQKTRIVRIEKN